MDFVSVVKTIKAQRGVTNTFYSMLCDYGAFDEEERWVKGIVKQICESGYAIRLSTLSASNRQWETEVSDMMYRITSQFGYREDVVSDIFHKLCLGMGLVGVLYDWVGAFQVSSPQSVSRSSVSGSSSGFSPQAAVLKASGKANGHDYVDLGLPSGTLWATCNVGASKPEDYGNYYAWGETRTKSTYRDDNYKYKKPFGYAKYCTIDYYGYNYFIDDLTELQTSDDPATMNWGSGWRTPTKEQWEELIEYTDSKWTTKSGICVLLFTSKMNSQKLFLSAAGSRMDSDDLLDAGSYGYYWSRSLDTVCPGCAWGLEFGPEDCSMSPHIRDSGFSVRPVR